jgi:hypothetical protein
MPLIESKGGSVVHSGFQHDGAAADLMKAFLGSGQQPGTQAAAAAFGQDINGDDMTYSTAAGFSDDETGDGAGTLFRLSHDGE